MYSVRVHSALCAHLNNSNHSKSNHTLLNRILLSCDDVMIDAVDDDGWTPLHAAVYWAQMDAAEQLVEHGANVNTVTGNVSIPIV